MIKLGFQAFKSKNYFWYFWGQGFSTMGSWMQYIALGWLTFKVTHSPEKLGIVNLFSTLPLFFLPTLASTLIDRCNKKNLILILQVIFLFQTSVLTVLSFTGNINFTVIMILSFTQGVTVSIDQPLKQTLILSLVENKDNLPNALAWNSFSTNISRIIAPSIAGIIIMMANESYCFLIDALSFLTMSIILLFKINWKETTFFYEKKSLFLKWKESIAYLKKTNLILSSLFMAFILSITLRTYTMLMPVISHDIYHGDAKTQGYLLTASGIGAVIASLWLTTASKDIQQIINRTILYSIISFIAFLIFSNNPFFLLGITSIGILGGTFILASVSLGTIIQMTVDDSKRTIVIGLLSSVLLASVPISNFFSSWMAEKMGIQNSLNILTMMGLIGLLYYAYRIKTLNLDSAVATYYD